MEDDIGDITRKHIINNPLTTQIQALGLLYDDPGIDKDLNHIAFNFGREKDELKQRLALKLIRKDYILRDINGFRLWCRKTGKRLCINGYKHEKVVKKFRKKQMTENVKSKRGEGAIVICHSTVPTPEELLLNKEQDSFRRELHQSQRLQVQRKIRNLVDSFPQETVTIVHLWAEENSPEGIALKIKKSRATVYRALKDFQKALIKEIGIEGILLTDKSLAAGLRPLVTGSLRRP